FCLYFSLLLFYVMLVFLLCTWLPPLPTLFPYTTLFRSSDDGRGQLALQLGGDLDQLLLVVVRHDERGRSEHLRHQRVHVGAQRLDRKSTRLNSSHVKISYAVFCLKKKKNGWKDLIYLQE